LSHVVAERVDGGIVDGEDGHAAATIEVHELGDGWHETLLGMGMRKCAHSTPAEAACSAISKPAARWYNCGHVFLGRTATLQPKESGIAREPVDLRQGASGVTQVASFTNFPISAMRWATRSGSWPPRL